MSMPFGLYKYNRMPFGLTKAPATFQQLMDRCLTSLNLTICPLYLDEVIVFGNNFEETLERLQIVLKRLSVFSLNCKPFHTKLPYLGHVVSALGMSPNPDNITALEEWLQHLL